MNAEDLDSVRVLFSAADELFALYQAAEVNPWTPDRVKAQIAAARSFKELIQSLEVVLRNEGTASAQLHKKLLRVYVRIGDVQSAMRCIAKLKTLEAPDVLAGEIASLLLKHTDSCADKTALVSQAELLVSSRKWRMAEDCLRRVSPCDWSCPAVVKLRARLLFRRRQFAAAEVCFAFLEDKSELPLELAILRAIGVPPPGYTAKLETLSALPTVLPAVEEWLRTEVISSESLGHLKMSHADLRLVIEVAAAACAHPRVIGHLIAEMDPHGLDSLLKSAAEKGWPIPIQAWKFAGEYHRRAKNHARAIQLYRLIHAAIPSDQDTQETLLLLENAACEEDALRPRAELDALLPVCLDRWEERYLHDPLDDGVRLAYGRILRIAERFGEARRVLEELAQDKPRDLSVLRELVHLAQSLRDTEDVAKWSLRLLEIRPGDDGAAIDALRAQRLLSGGEAAASTMPCEADSPGLCLEHLRNLFTCGDFAGVTREGEQVLVRFPSDARLHLILAAASLELGALDEASSHLETAARHGGRVRCEIPLFYYAIQQRRSGIRSALRWVNSYFASITVQPVDLQQSYGDVAFDQFMAATPNPPSSSGPLVSVIMTCCDVEEYVQTAVRSILQQSYGNLELIVVDDASSDGTLEKLRKIAAVDPRVRVIVNQANEGTYVSKNRALSVASGEYIAFQDADDWSHPDRVSRCVSVLNEHHHIAALRTQWMRMTNEGETVIRPRGNIADNCCISLFMRRAVYNRIGYFDSVRADADVEYVHRLRLATGPSAFPDLPWLLMFGRVREGALTSSGLFGMTRGGYNPLRQKYRESYRAFHRAIVEGESPYLDFPLRERKFAAPSEMITG